MFRVGLGFRVHGLGIRVSGLGFRGFEAVVDFYSHVVCLLLGSANVSCGEGLRESFTADTFPNLWVPYSFVGQIRQTLCLGLCPKLPKQQMFEPQNPKNPEP